MNQKNEEIKELLAENKALRMKLNDRPLPSESCEQQRKIEELEQIIETLKYELETLRITQDTARMTDVLVKSSQAKQLNQSRLLNQSRPLNNTRSSSLPKAKDAK